MTSSTGHGGTDMTDHEDLRDALTGYATGALDHTSALEVKAHLETCADCRAELAEIQRVVAGVDLSLDPMSPPADLKARVLAAAVSHPRASEASRGPSTDRAVRSFRPPAGAGSAGLPDRSRDWTLSGLALAASLTLAVAAGIYAWSLRTQVTALRQMAAESSQQAAALRDELASVRRDWVRLSRTMDVLKAPDMLRVDLKGQPGAAGATGRAYWSRGRGIVFTADRLPAIDPTRVFQLWTIKGTTATSAGLLTREPNGTAAFTAPVRDDAEPPDAFGVTIEPAGGSQTPTLPIVLMGQSDNR